MKKFQLLSLLIILSFSPTFAQISQGGYPISLLSSEISKSIHRIYIEKPNVEKLIMQDIEEGINKGRMRVGILLEANLNPNYSGKWETLQNGSKLWRLNINAPDAVGLNLYFDNFYLPEGVSLFVYSPDYKQIIGAFTDFNNSEDGTMATQIIEGEELVLEMLVPKNINQEEAMLNISEIGYRYKNFGVHHDLKSRNDGADECLVNINCPEGDNWQKEKRGVVKLLMRIGMSNYECSGSLVNNTHQNCIPYILTAFHCGDGASANNLKQWIFYFGYEASTCNGTTGLLNKTSTGCTLIATDKWDGYFTTTSDFFLIRLNKSVPNSYQPYYNGWTLVDTAATEGVGIHHPQGDIKKISTFTTKLSNHINFWGVVWSSTVTNHSITEPGSSGSPLFNSNKEIIGTLTSGLSFCDKPEGKDVYGKFNIHWDIAGETPDKQLKAWLDPNNSNPISMPGLNYTNCTDVSVGEHLKPNLNVSIFPNPASDFINLKFENYYFSTGNITIYDMLGNIVFVKDIVEYENELQIDIKSLPSGIYMVLAKDKQHILNKSFVKQ
jgi:hypothetical protein